MSVYLTTVICERICITYCDILALTVLCVSGWSSATMFRGIDVIFRVKAEANNSSFRVRIDVISLLQMGVKTRCDMQQVLFKGYFP